MIRDLFEELPVAREAVDEAAADMGVEPAFLAKALLANRAS